MGGGPPASRPRRVVLLVAPRVFWAPEGPAAREARRPHFVRRRASKPARALRSLRRPPHQWGWVADVWFSASSRSPARPRHRPPAPEVSRVKPPSPLQTGEVCLLKPPSPLRVRNGCFWRIFGLQWCHWFQRWLVWVEQRRHRFHADPTQCCRPWGGLLRGGVYVFGREKFALRAQYTPNSALLCLLGEFFSHQPAAPKPCRRRGALQARYDGGFAPCEALRRRVAGVSHPCMAQFPPIGGGAARVCGGVATKVQTHWVKNSEKGLFWLNGSALWRVCPLMMVRCAHTNPLLRALTRYFARNSPTTASKAELPSLELQRLQAISKSDRIKLRATFGSGHP